jgi:hypothetical protein
MALRFCGAAAAVVLAFVQMGCATPGSKASTREQREQPNQWRISNGTVELVVDSAKGRIMFYGFRGGQNVLWANAAPENPKYVIGGWSNYGGDKIWLWPQELWKWPPPEPKGYEVLVSDDGRSLRMISTPWAGNDVRVIRWIEMAPQGTQVTITTSLQATGRRDGIPRAAWSITQVPTPERIVARFPLASSQRAYLERCPSKDDRFVARSLGEGIVDLRWPGDRGVKTLLDADAFAAVWGGTVLLQHQLSTVGSDAWAPQQRAQIYCHGCATNIPPGPSYTELEWTAPIAPPERLASNPLRVTWRLAKTAEPVTDTELISMLDEVIRADRADSGTTKQLLRTSAGRDRER